MLFPVGTWSWRAIMKDGISLDRDDGIRVAELEGIGLLRFMAIARVPLPPMKLIREGPAARLAYGISIERNRVRFGAAYRMCDLRFTRRRAFRMGGKDDEQIIIRFSWKSNRDRVRVNIAPGAVTVSLE